MIIKHNHIIGIINERITLDAAMLEEGILVVTPKEIKDVIKTAKESGISTVHEFNLNIHNDRSANPTHLVTIGEDNHRLCWLKSDGQFASFKANVVVADNDNIVIGANLAGGDWYHTLDELDMVLTVVASSAIVTDAKKGPMVVVHVKYDIVI